MPRKSPNPVTLVVRDVTDTTATTTGATTATTVETAAITTTVETAATTTTCLSRVVSAQKVFRSTNQYNILPRYSKIILKFCAEDLC